MMLAACAGGETAVSSEAPGGTTGLSESSPFPDQECSASHLTIRIGDQDLPDEVAQMRDRIIVAALTCDYEELSNLAIDGGGPFQHSLDADAATPIEFWRAEEQAGGQTMADLIRVLSLPAEKLEVAGELWFVWPAAAARPAPEPMDWNALASVFTPARMQRMRQDAEAAAGRYVGRRVGISSSGDWAFYVSGQVQAADR